MNWTRVSTSRGRRHPRPLALRRAAPARARAKRRQAAPARAPRRGSTGDRQGRGRGEPPPAVRRRIPDRRASASRRDDLPAPGTGSSGRGSASATCASPTTTSGTRLARMSRRRGRSSAASTWTRPPRSLPIRRWAQRPSTQLRTTVSGGPGSGGSGRTSPTAGGGALHGSSPRRLRAGRRRGGGHPRQRPRDRQRVVSVPLGLPGLLHRPPHSLLAEWGEQAERGQPRQRLRLPRPNEDRFARAFERFGAVVARYAVGVPEPARLFDAPGRGPISALTGRSVAS